jgi:hypothetical protein
MQLALSMSSIVVGDFGLLSPYLQQYFLGDKALVDSRSSS